MPGTTSRPFEPLPKTGFVDDTLTASKYGIAPVIFLRSNGENTTFVLRTREEFEKLVQSKILLILAQSPRTGYSMVEYLTRLSGSSYCLTIHICDQCLT
jgi:hypothetical protein